MILTIVVFILILGLLIFVHEFGHFIMAKRAGVKVEEFGFGFPPKIFGIKKGETLYSLNLFPIGGFVRIYGEMGKPTKGKKQVGGRDEGRAFYNKPIKTKTKITAAGVIMNLFLAAFLLGLGHWLGLPTIVEDDQVDDLSKTRVQVTQVAFNSPAAEVDIKIGDTIASLKLKIDSSTVPSVNEESRGKIAGSGVYPERSEGPAQDDVVIVSTVKGVQEFVNTHRGKEITLVIQRGNDVLEKTLVPRVDPPVDEGPLGVGLARTAIVSYPWYRALVMGITSTVKLIWMMVTILGGLLWRLLIAGELAVEIAGPVGIFSLTGQAAQLGFIYILQLTALLSINLAIINALPFPALDGGRLLFLAIEKIKGSPVSQKIERIAHTTGFVILILLMIAITWRDVVRFF